MKITFHRIGGHEFPLKTTAGAGDPSSLRPSSATTPTPAPAEPALPHARGSQVSAPDPSLAVGKPQ